MNGSDIAEFEAFYAEEIQEAWEEERQKNPDADYDKFVFDSYVDHCASLSDLAYDAWKDGQIEQGK